MNILVTGGAGFVGSALARRLADAGHTVVVVDNFNDYYDVSLKRARVENFLNDIALIEADLLDEDAMKEIFSQHRFDVVCHLAGQAGVRYSIERPVQYVDENVNGTTRLYELMRTHDVTRMVFASSSSVYGNDSKVPFVETAAADRPVSVYAATKRACELIGHSYFAQYGIESSMLRFFTVYGPWVRPDMAILKFAQLMHAGQPIDVYNEGKLRRDFTHIDDIVSGFMLAVEKPLGYKILNLGRSESTELMTYISLLEEHLGMEAIKKYLPMQPGDVYETYANTTKARELLGFEAKVSIEEGMKTFTDWFKRYYQ